MTEPGRLGGVAIVTGGTGGLGQAVVGELLDAGAQVVTTWLAEAERDAAEAAFGDEGLTLGGEPARGRRGHRRGRCDQAGPPDLARQPRRRLRGGPRLHEAEPAGLEKMLALNLTTAVNAARAAIPAMLDGDGGAIVCVGTKVAYQPFSGGAAYAISKSAVLALVRSLDVEYREDGIRANAIVPNVIDTPANRESMPDADHSKWVQPAEIARVIRFLCSADSSPVTGAAIPVYGRTG